jgi:hypothetical protein
MSILKILFELFLIYLAYKLIFDFIIPVYKTTKQMKQKMSDLNARMEEQQRRSASTNATSAAKPASKTVAGDYIDYEEIK